jgi:hypothetical protein
MSTDPQLFDQIVTAWRAAVATTVEPDYFDDFVGRNRPEIQRLIERWRQTRAARRDESELFQQDLAAIDLACLPVAWRRDLEALEDAAAGRPIPDTPARRLTGRGVFTNNTVIPKIIHDRSIEWSVSPGLNLNVRGRAVASGPEERLEVFGRVLHRLGYPEVYEAVWPAFGVGHPFGLQPPDVLEKRILSAERAGKDPADRIARDWVAAHKAGRLRVPELPNAQRRLIAELSADEFTIRDIEELGLAPAQWALYAQPVSDHGPLALAVLSRLPAPIARIAEDLLPPELQREALIRKLLARLRLRELVERDEGDRWTRTKQGDALSRKYPRYRCQRCGVEVPQPIDHVAMWVSGKPIHCLAADTTFEETHR